MSAANSAAVRASWANPDTRRNRTVAIKAAASTPESRERSRAIALACWADPIVRKRAAMAVRGPDRRPKPRHVTEWRAELSKAEAALYRKRVRLGKGCVVARLEVERLRMLDPTAPAKGLRRMFIDGWTDERIAKGLLLPVRAVVEMRGEMDRRECANGGVARAFQVGSPQ
jgi:hypothetical protein